MYDTTKLMLIPNIPIGLTLMDTFDVMMDYDSYMSMLQCFLILRIIVVSPPATLIRRLPGSIDFESESKGEAMACAYGTRVRSYARERGACHMCRTFLTSS
jgi:hypothetical protein